MKEERFTLDNLPLSFLDDFFDIEADEVKEYLLDIVNALYGDYSIKEVQDMFATFTSTTYEVWELNLYRSDYGDNNEFQYKLDMVIEAILYCATQFESYKVYNPVKAFNNRRRR